MRGPGQAGCRLPHGGGPDGEGGALKPLKERCFLFAGPSCAAWPCFADSMIKGIEGAHLLRELLPEEEQEEGQDRPVAGKDSWAAKKRRRRSSPWPPCWAGAGGGALHRPAHLPHRAHPGAGGGSTACATCWRAW